MLPVPRMMLAVRALSALTVNSFPTENKNKKRYTAGVFTPLKSHSVPLKLNSYLHKYLLYPGVAYFPIWWFKNRLNICSNSCTFLCYKVSALFVSFSLLRFTFLLCPFREDIRCVCTRAFVENRIGLSARYWTRNRTFP